MHVNNVVFDKNVTKLFTILKKMFSPSRTLQAILIECTEAALRRCSSKQMFLKISQISKESTCLGASF